MKFSHDYDTFVTQDKILDIYIIALGARSHILKNVVHQHVIYMRNSNTKPGEKLFCTSSIWKTMDWQISLASFCFLHTGLNELMLLIMVIVTIDIIMVIVNYIC